jgi:hypothetical protein
MIIGTPYETTQERPISFELKQGEYHFRITVSSTDVDGMTVMDADGQFIPYYKSDCWVLRRVDGEERGVCFLIDESPMSEFSSRLEYDKYAYRAATEMLDRHLIIESDKMLVPKDAPALSLPLEEHESKAYRKLIESAKENLRILAA